MQFLSTSEIIDLHKRLIDRFGGLHGMRDKNLLESALGYPKLLYSIKMERDVYNISASYGYHLINNHPFIDGNKRVGSLAMATFLRINDVQFYPEQKKLYDIAINIAMGEISEQKVAVLLRES